MFCLFFFSFSSQSLLSSRLVITFSNRSSNLPTNADLLTSLYPNSTLVKRYGRRMVLDLRRPFELAVEEGVVRRAVLAVERVEADVLINAGEVEDFINVTEIMSADNVAYEDVDVPDRTIYPQDYAGQVPPLTQWNLMDSEPYSIRAEGVWKMTNSTPSVVVAVIDTGLAAPAREYFLNVVDGYDFISDADLALDWDGRDPDATDPGDWGDYCPTPSWHGTRVASILAARHDNKFGMRGVAQNCSVMPVRVLGLCKMGYANDVTDAIVWAAGGTIDGVPVNPLPAKILSLSLAGQGECPSYLQSAIDLAISLGSVVVAAAGNNNKDVLGYFPANCKGVIAVAASTRQGTLAGYSNYGNLLTVSAPGGDFTNPIMTLKVDATETDLLIAYGTGTSFSVPHAAAILSLYFNGKIINMTNDLRWRYVDFKICSVNFCGKGIISAQTTYDWGIPFGNQAGYILNSNSDAFSWSGTQQGGNFFVQCGVERFLCLIWIFTDFSGSNYGASRGFKYACCNMWGEETFWSNCIGYACSGVWATYWRTHNGWFGTIAVHPVGQMTDGFHGVLSFGSGNTQAIIDKGTCPSGTVVNGLYGSVGTTIDWNIVLCRSLFVPCPAGFYSLGPIYAITACPAGTHNPNTGQGSLSACITCNYPSFALSVGRSSCTACKTCPAGQYMSSDCTNLADRTCGICSSGLTFTSAANQLSCAQCSNCVAGTRKTGNCIVTSDTACEPCPLGVGFTTSLNQLSCSNCGTCTAGNRMTADCTRSSNRICSPCTSLLTYTTTDNQPSCATCGVCPAGTRKIGDCTTTSNTRCENCIEKSSYTSGDNQVSCSECTTCPKGSRMIADCTRSSDRACEACPGSTYTSSSNQPSCLTCNSCAAGTRKTADCAATSDITCEDCITKSTFTTSVNQGTCTACQICEAGRRMTSECTKTSNRVCENCPPGTFTTSANQGTCTPCTVCEAGFYILSDCTTSSDRGCRECPTGHYCPAGSTSPIPCDEGTYSSSLRAVSSAICLDCISGYYAKDAGSSACTQCSPASVCPNGQIPVACTGMQDLRCFSCTGKPSTADYISPTSCAWKCKIGFYRVRDYCVKCKSFQELPCGVGQYFETCIKSDGSEAIEDSQCKSCTNGPPYISYFTSVSDVEGESRCLWECNLGYYKSDSRTTCDTCYGGSISQAGAQSLQDCVQCAAGKYIFPELYMTSEFDPYPRVTECQNCGRGTFSAGEGTFICYDCDRGSYASGYGSTVCLLCQRGKFLDAIGSRSSSDCVSCYTGYYAAAAGSAECQICESPKFSVQPQGATQCLGECDLCEAGQYNKGCGGSSQGGCFGCSNT